MSFIYTCNCWKLYDGQGTGTYDRCTRPLIRTEVDSDNNCIHCGYHAVARSISRCAFKKGKSRGGYTSLAVREACKVKHRDLLIEHKVHLNLTSSGGSRDLWK